MLRIFFTDIVSAMSLPKSDKDFADELDVFHELDRSVEEQVIMIELASYRDRVHHWENRKRVESNLTAPRQISSYCIQSAD